MIDLMKSCIIKLNQLFLTDGINLFIVDKKPKWKAFNKYYKQKIKIHKISIKLIVF